MKNITKKSIGNTLLGAALAVGLMFGSCQKEKQINQGPGMTNTEAGQSGNYPAKSIESLCKDYFTAKKNENDNSAKIISVTNEFLFVKKSTKEFSRKNP